MQKTEALSPSFVLFIVLVTMEVMHCYQWLGIQTPEPRCLATNWLNEETWLVYVAGEEPISEIDETEMKIWDWIIGGIAGLESPDRLPGFWFI